MEDDTNNPTKDDSQPEDATTGGAMPETPEGQKAGLEADSAEIPPTMEGPSADSGQATEPALEPTPSIKSAPSGSEGQEPQPTEAVMPQTITPSGPPTPKASEGQGVAPSLPAQAGEPAESSLGANNQVGKANDQSFIKNLLAKAGEKIQFNKRKKLDKVMELARKKGSVVNSDVEKLLYVSHPTASRYLRQLVKENKLKVSGKSVDSKYEPV